QAARLEDYELAARYRDQLQALREVRRHQKIVTGDGIDRDIIGLALSSHLATAVIFKIRDDTLVGREVYRLKVVRDTRMVEISASVLRLIYSHLTYLPKEIIIDVEPEDVDIFRGWLKTKSKHTVRLRTNPKGERRKLLNWATRNAEFELGEELAKRPLPRVLIELERRLRLDKVPRWIEAFDVSNIMGKEATGSSVAFIDGRPRKSLYRHYRIKTVAGIDDCAMIREIVCRRIKRCGTKIPDLFLIDGGKGQLNAAKDALRESPLEIQSSPLPRVQTGSSTMMIGWSQYRYPRQP
ncbi:MAG TPA: hypothetical protein EYP58_02955, partial [bacterium (Candidatus Stahlbacteria)]|nr:hypothetical protein [Candidatus Stahlbacteria bacterium]